MDEWQGFFLAQAGAAGVLAGLVFVGVSINLDKILSDPSSGLTGRAAALIGAEVLAVGLVAWGWVTAIHLLRLRGWQTMRPDLRAAFVVRVALGQIATIPTIVGGITVLSVGLGGLYVLVAGTVCPILVALFGAWVLLIEINR